MVRLTLSLDFKVFSKRLMATMEDDFQGFSQSFLNTYQSDRIDSNLPFRKIIILFFCTFLWTLLMTAIPLGVHVPPQNYYNHHDKWYTGNDIMRFLEPIGGTIFNFFVFYWSGIFKRDPSWRTTSCIVVFLLGLALYGQGSGFHSAANIFSNSLETIDYDDTDMQDLYFYMRTIWEHIVGHYLYAIGYGMMNIAQFYAYKDHKSPSLGLPKDVKVMLVLAAIAYAALIAGVAADFPSGSLVGLIFLVIYGMGVIGGYMAYKVRSEKDAEMLHFGKRPVVHMFFLAYLLALLFVIAWVIAVGGFKTRKQAGVME